LEEDDFDPTAYAEEGDDLDLSGEHIDAHQCVVEEPDANELFWDEFFDSLIITVPFTFLYILLDMYVIHPFFCDLAMRNQRLKCALTPASFICNINTDPPLPKSFHTLQRLLLVRLRDSPF